MKRFAAFTLAELLAVIVIVASLMAVLGPAIASARKAAKSSVCVSNLQQIGLAAQMYVSDNDDRYPWAVNEIHRRVHFLNLGCPPAQLSQIPTNHVQALMPYVKSVSAFLCPLDTGRSFLDPAKAVYPTLFSYNGGTSYFFAELVDGQTPASWADPTKQAYATDGSPAWHGDETYFGGRVNALFYDWHAAARRLGGNPIPQTATDFVPK